MVSNPNIGGACNRSVTKGVPVDAQQTKNKKWNRKEQNDRNVAPACIAFSLGSSFDRNRVVEGIGFSSDGSAGRLVGLQAEAGLPWAGSGAVRSDCGAASEFERQRFLIALGLSCFQQQSRLQHSSIRVGSAPVPVS